MKSIRLEHGDLTNNTIKIDGYTILEAIAILTGVVHKIALDSHKVATKDVVILNAQAEKEK